MKQIIKKSSRRPVAFFTHSDDFSLQFYFTLVCNLILVRQHRNIKTKKKNVNQWVFNWSLLFFFMNKVLLQSSCAINFVQNLLIREGFTQMIWGLR